jgi:hypothetical protein
MASKSASPSHAEASGDSFSPNEEEGPVIERDVPPGQLTAGEWRDLDNWPFWCDLLDEQGGEGWQERAEHWQYNTLSRLPVIAMSGDKPAMDVQVMLLNAVEEVIWTARTDNQGRAELFADLFEPSGGPYWLVVQGHGRTVTQRIDRWASGEALVVQVESTRPRHALDLMFVVDTTGSMGDELEYLKSELVNVIDQVQERNGQELAIRTSVNFYRDQGDEYVVQPFGFTGDPKRAQRQIGRQRADGGGDYEEAVELALEDAIEAHDWRKSATSRLLFLVLDAPPHHRESIVAKLHRTTRLAAEKGIRIIPIAASGVDKDTEFLLRFLAVSTGGTYLFLTDHSGIGNAHLQPTIGQYDVHYLNDLLVNLINASVA